jgi:hypothetical protein
MRTKTKKDTTANPSSLTIRCFCAYIAFAFIHCHVCIFDALWRPSGYDPKDFLFFCAARTYQMMLNNSYRKKLLHAVLYFATKVKNPSKVKIFKLLYFLDFEHYRQTGQSVTNLDYFAYDFGPVPKDFYQEVGDNVVPEDFVHGDHAICLRRERKKGGHFQSKSEA